MCSTQVEDVREANIFANRRIFPGNNEYRRWDAGLFNRMHPASANMCVEPRWKTLDRRIFSLIGKYFPDTTNIDVGTPNCSIQCTHVMRRHDTEALSVIYDSPGMLDIQILGYVECTDAFGEDADAFGGWTDHCTGFMSPSPTKNASGWSIENARVITPHVITLLFGQQQLLSYHQR